MPFLHKVPSSPGRSRGSRPRNGRRPHGPERPIRIIVPYAAGGFTDVVARPVGTRLAEKLAQPVIVENKPGASTMLGAEAAAHAPPDGYTLLMATTSTISTNALLFRKMTYKGDGLHPRWR
mgnify:CR=1 FL=1